MKRTALFLLAAVFAAAPAIPALASETLPPPITGPTFASDTCDPSATTIFDGLVYGQYVMIKTHTSGSTTSICYRHEFSFNASEGIGGKITVSAGSLAPGVPTTDSDYGACTATAGNTAPGPHPILSGFLGDPSDPPAYLPYLIDTYVSSTNDRWVCVRLGPAAVRVKFASSSASPPGLTVQGDPSYTRNISGMPDTGTASSTECKYSGLTVMNAQVGPFHVWLRPAATSLGSCFRITGPNGMDYGGYLRLAPSYPGALFVSQSDVTPCTVNVLHNDSPAFDVTRSPTGAVPASICVVAGGQKLRLTVDDSTAPPRVVDYVPNAGTPDIL